DRDFCRSPVSQHVQERDDGIGWKVHRSLATAEFIQDLAKRQRHQLDLGFHALEVLGRQSRQEMVLATIMTGRHGDSCAVACGLGPYVLHRTQRPVARLSSPTHRTTASIVRTLQVYGSAQLVDRTGPRCTKPHMR